MSTTTSTYARTGAVPTDLLEQLQHFDGPPDEFLSKLLGVQCALADAEQAALLRPDAQKGAAPLAVYPRYPQEPEESEWLERAVQWAPRVASSNRSRSMPLRSDHDLYGIEPSHHLVLIPIRQQTGVRGVGAYLLEQRDAQRLEETRRRLEMSLSLLALYETRLTLQRRRADLARLRQSCEVLNEVNRHKRFKAAAMAMCSEAAAGWEAKRVSLGLIRGRYVKLQAMSHTEKFKRKTELVQAIESAMEECADQDIALSTPATEEQTAIRRATQELDTHYGPSSVLSLPLRHEGETRGVLTLERDRENPFGSEEIESLRLTCELCTPRLIEISERDRWFGARAVSGVRKALAWLVGPRHTWIKAAAIATAAALLFVFLGTGTYRVEAPFKLQAAHRQIVAAPFNGYLVAAPAQPGDRVIAGQTLLAKLDASKLRLKLAQAQAQRQTYLKQARIARREDKVAQEQIALAKAERVAAKIDLLQWRIDHATIRAPITGVVLSGDLRQQIGAPVKAGQTLFKIAPLDALRVRMAVPEDRIADVRVGQEGVLAAASHPGVYLPFEVTRISPMAQVAGKRNVFYVWARLREAPDWLRPGMKGVAKIKIDQRSYAWIWTHELIDWLRMKLWL